MLYHKIFHVFSSDTFDDFLGGSSFSICDFSNSVLCVDVRKYWPLTVGGVAVSLLYDEDEIKHPRIKIVDKIVKIKIIKRSW